MRSVHEVNKDNIRATEVNPLNINAQGINIMRTLTPQEYDKLLRRVNASRCLEKFVKIASSAGKYPLASVIRKDAARLR